MPNPDFKSSNHFVKVEQSFSKAARTYAQEAMIQNAMGTFLQYLLISLTKAHSLSSLYLSRVPNQKIDLLLKCSANLNQDQTQNKAKTIAFPSKVNLNGQIYTFDLSEQLNCLEQQFFSTFKLKGGHLITNSGDLCDSAKILDYLKLASLDKDRAEKAKFKRVLEIGCGPGNFTQNLFDTIEFEHLILNDLSQSMLDLNLQNIKNSKACQLLLNQKISSVCANALDLNLAHEQRVNLLISNATFQWFLDLSHFIEHLKQNCFVPAQESTQLLAYSSFMFGTFKELHSLVNHGLTYINREDLISILAKEFKYFWLYEFNVMQYFKDVKHLLAHLKKTGVNGLNKNPLSISQLKEFMHTYQNTYSDQHGTYLTWNPYFVIALN